MSVTPPVPSLHDHHSHVSLYAALRDAPDLAPLPRESVPDFLRALPRDRLTLVKGWRSDRLAMDEDLLSDMPPLLVINASLHGYALSPAGLPFVSELWPEFAARIGDRGWAELHLPDLFAFYTSLAGLTVRKLTAFMDELASLGIGSVEDMTIGGSETLRLFSAAGLGGRIVSWASPAVLRALPAGDRRLCAGAKIFLDGSLGARSAALDLPFTDAAPGELLYSDEDLRSLLGDVADLTGGLAVHAIGGRAIGQALRVLRQLREDGLEFSPARLEHVQFITEEQGRAARDLGLCLSMQPNFSADSTDYADRLSPAQRAANNPFRMLIDRLGFVPGVDLIFGSDGMPHGLGAALTASLFPQVPQQSLAMEEYLAGSCAPDGIRSEGPGFAVEIVPGERIVSIVPVG
ncbi:MAG TPA: amidohydrolase family protein [Rectinemataceae bacterium]|nr:amidohydrolase family protein [Rectinemataceae bacterium]